MLVAWTAILREPSSATTVPSAACQTAVQRELKSPSKPDFTKNAGVFKRDAGFIVVGQVNALNAQGQTQRFNYVCRTDARGAVTGKAYAGG